MTAPKQPKQDRLLKLRDVLELLNIDHATFYRMRARGAAPRCIRLPSGHLRFRPSAIEAWIREHEEDVAC